MLSIKYWSSIISWWSSHELIREIYLQGVWRFMSVVAGPLGTYQLSTLENIRNWSRSSWGCLMNWSVSAITRPLIYRILKAHDVMLIPLLRKSWSLSKPNESIWIQKMKWHSVLVDPFKVEWLFYHTSKARITTPFNNVLGRWIPMQRRSSAFSKASLSG